MPTVKQKADDLQSDPAETERFLRVLHPDGEVLELRVPGTLRGTQSGFYDVYWLLARDAAALSGQAPGIYVSINAVCREANNEPVIVTSTVQDKEIERLITLFVDFDARREKGISSTDAEHQSAIELAYVVAEWLKEAYGWPDPLTDDSGNGGHLFFRIDLENIRENVELLHGVLKALAQRFDTDAVKVDTTTFNPSRIAKLPGTLAAKGPNTPERPHRLARILSMPDRLEPVTPEQLQAVAALASGGKTKATASERKQRTPVMSPGDDAGDDPRLALALRKDEKFARLWAGDTSMHEDDESRADEALCCKIIFWFSRDPWSIDQRFRQSGLYRNKDAYHRDKWERADYRRETIRKALQQQKESYNDPTVGATPDTENPTVRTVYDVRHTEYTEPVEIVEGIIYSGASILAGRPKEGKSYLSLLIALGVVFGKPVAGWWSVTKPGRVLYLDLENGPRRCSQRLAELEPDIDTLMGAADERMSIVFDVAPFNAGGREQLDDMLTGGNYRLVVIDTLFKFTRGQSQPKNNSITQGEYDLIDSIRAVAVKHGTALLLLHHSGKPKPGGGGTVIDRVLGTTGTTAPVDAVLGMEKMPGQNATRLEVVGRDIAEQQYELYHPPDSMLWEVRATGDEVGLNAIRREVIELLRAEGSQTVSVIAKKLGRNYEAMRKLLNRMAFEGKLKREERTGKFAAP